MSCELDLGVQEVVERIWKELRLIRIYTKRYASILHPGNPMKISNVKQERRGARFQRSVDCTEQFYHRGRLR